MYPMCVQKPKDLDHLPQAHQLSQAHQQGARLKMQRLGLDPCPCGMLVLQLNLLCRDSLSLSASSLYLSLFSFLCFFLHLCPHLFSFPLFPFSFFLPLFHCPSFTLALCPLRNVLQSTPMCTIPQFLLESLPNPSCAFPM